MRSARVQLHLTSLPGGRLGRDAYRFVDWLAAAGQTWWQVLPLGPPDRYRSPYKSRSAFAAWPGLLADPRAPVSALGAAATSATATPTGSRTGCGSAAGEGSPTRCASSASGPRCGRYAADRGVRLFGDVAIYVAPGSVDHRAASRAVPRRRGRRGPARRVLGDRAAVGQPAVRLAGDAPPALPLVGGAATTDAVAVRSGADRPLPRIRRLLGGARRCTDGGRRSLAARAWSGGVRCGCPRSRAAGAGRRGPRGDHPGGGAPARRARACRGCWCSSSASIPASGRALITPTTTSRTGSCTPGPTTTTPPVGGTRRSMRGVARWSTHALAARGIVDRDSVVGADPAGLLRRRRGWR